MSLAGPESWDKGSWRDFKIKQHPVYKDENRLLAVEKELSSYPSLVSSDEIDALRGKVAQASKGRSFLLQCGECAESFSQLNFASIYGVFRTVLQMGMIISFAGGFPVVKIGRLAGQFAKPRSIDTECVDGVRYLSYRGDMINSYDFSDREPDPSRLLRGYHHSASTLNLLRVFFSGGFASLKRVHDWNLECVMNNDFCIRHKDIISSIGESLSFIEACGIDIASFNSLRGFDFYTSHEALVLNYEEALTRKDPVTGDWYDYSAHMLWVGDRTRDLDHAHIEFLRGISNPVGVKIGPAADVRDVLSMCNILNPRNEEGRLILIVRMGADLICERLPALLSSVLREGYNVLWVCDPMHGNTKISSTGHKTRYFDDVLGEVRSFFEIHKSYGSIAGGLHLEMTGSDVTECLGGVSRIDDRMLGQRYETRCDPRLNGAQSLELSLFVSDILRDTP